MRILFLMAIVMLATAANAETRVWVKNEDGDAIPYLCDEPYHRVGCRKDWATIKRMVRKHREPEVRSWQRLEDIDVAPAKSQCPHRKPLVSVVGTEHLNEKTAIDRAETAWMDQVRYFHGEMFVTLDKAYGFKRVCSRSSTGDSVTARVLDKISENAGVLYRCRIDAYPCAVLPEEVGK